MVEGVKQSLAASILGQTSSGSDKFTDVTSNTKTMTNILDQCGVKLSQVTR